MMTTNNHYASMVGMLALLNISVMVQLVEFVYPAPFTSIMHTYFSVIQTLLSAPDVKQPGNTTKLPTTEPQTENR